MESCPYAKYHVMRNHRSRPVLPAAHIKLLLASLLFCAHVPLHGQSSDLAQGDRSTYLLRKGNMYTGATFSFNRAGTNNESRLGVLIEEQERNDFTLNLDIGRFVRDNWAFGGIMAFSQGKRIGREVGSDNVAADVSTITRSLGLYASMKNLIPLDPRDRFFLFSQILLGGQTERELKESVSEGILTRTFISTNAISLRILPGIMVNVIDGFCVEAGLEIAGLRGSWSDTEVNGIHRSDKYAVSGDLTLNLLRMTLGFYYYFDATPRK